MIFPIKKILCPIDFNEPSYTALKVANDFTLKFSARIVLLHIVSPIQGTPTSDATISLHAREYLEQMENIAKRALKQLVLQKLSPRISAVTRVIHANPSDGIVDTAKDEKADIIVISVNGQTGWKRFLFGSVAERVIREAHCLVLAIPHRRKNTQRGEE